MALASSQTELAGVQIGPDTGPEVEPVQQVEVQVSGYFYAVNLGPHIRPQHHRVGKDRRCTCTLGAGCPAVSAVAEYLRAGGERTPAPPAGYFPVVPATCPICGAETFYVPSLNSNKRGAGWACTRGSETHYWELHSRILRSQLEAKHSLT